MKVSIIFLFQVKGLSSLAHESLQDSKAIKPPSFVGSTTTQTRICQVSSSPIPVTPIMPKVENGNYSSPVCKCFKRYNDINMWIECN